MGKETVIKTVCATACMLPTVLWADSAVLTPEAFANPPFVYRPIATIGGGGPMPQDIAGLARKLFLERGFGSFMFSPEGDDSRSRPSFSLETLKKSRPVGLMATYPPEASPWLPKALPGEEGFGSFMQLPPTKPKDAAGAAPPPPMPRPEPSLGFMTDAYFGAVGKALKVAQENSRYATFYDEVAFPSGAADHTIPEKYFRKVLRRTEDSVAGGADYGVPLPTDGQVMAVVATNVATKKRISLTPYITGNAIKWHAPPGSWQVQVFTCVTAKGGTESVDYYGTSDYMDPKAVAWFIDHSYQKIADHFSPYLGSTINMTFFDDVGVFSDEKTWNPAIDAKFRELTGRDSAVYYPALWDDIGPDTAAARVGFFAARAELIGAGFPKMVTDWDHQHGVKSSGHTPGNYDVQPVDMNGDPFKFYQWSDIPMVDVIFGHGFGRSGYKIISSAADELDKPLVAAETFSSGGDAMGYRRMIELYVRGINRFVTGQGPRSEPIGKPADFAEWSGRASLLLQGGAHVADVAILYPIASLEAFYLFDAPGNPRTLPAGMYVSKDTDYEAVGEMLLDELHRDFTFVHPDAMGTEKLRVEGDKLVMNNKVNREEYRAALIPGGDVVSLPALKKIQQYFASGGVVIATSLLPFKSSEFGKDKEVQSIIKGMFGIDPARPMPESTSTIQKSAKGGKAIFIRHPSKESLGEALELLGVTHDVQFANNPTPTAGNGIFSYIHKRKEGKDIYFIGNSSDTTVDTTVQVRGALLPALWDPHTGTITSVESTTITRDGETFTQLPLHVPGLRSVFIVATAKN
jgi:hypothetical protein